MSRIILTVLYAALLVAGFLVFGLIFSVVNGIFGDTITFLLVIAGAGWLCWHWAGKDRREDHR